MSADRTEGTTSEGSKPASIAYLDTAHWKRLISPETGDGALQSWLALLCSEVGRGARGVLVLRRTGPFRPVAFYPEQSATSRFLMETVNEALAQRIDLIRERPDARGTVGIARLIRYDTRVIAVVGLEVDENREGARQDVLRRLQWASAWIEVFERRRSSRSDEHAIKRLTFALDAIAVAGEQNGFRAAAMAALTSLSVQTSAARVSFGRRRMRGCRVAAVSNTTRFDRRVAQVRNIARAMDEAVDQVAGIEVVEGAATDERLISAMAVRLAEQRRSSCVIAQPYVRGGRPAGAMVFEWAKNDLPPKHVREAVADITMLLGPILHDRMEEERWLIGRAVSVVGRQLARLVGPGYLGRKVAIAALAAVVAFFATFRTEFKVTADARLRGAIERVVMAPIDGYIVEAPPRAGDAIGAGNLLVQFDDVEYQLERFAWTARKLQYESEYAQSLAKFDRAGINILRARIEEAEAQVALNDTRIKLARVEAPFDAVIVSGDLSQSLGQSVQRGDELFRIAPLSSYVVEIEVPESDILYVREGNPGRLVLTSLPDTSLDLVVDKVTPVTSAAGGQNHFLVEATLSDPGASPVAPGMEGIAKIEAGQELLIWIWTRRLIDWIRLGWWRWAP